MWTEGQNVSLRGVWKLWCNSPATLNKWHCGVFCIWYPRYSHCRATFGKLFKKLLSFFLRFCCGSLHGGVIHGCYVSLYSSWINTAEGRMVRECESVLWFICLYETIGLFQPRSTGAQWIMHSSLSWKCMLNMPRLKGVGTRCGESMKPLSSYVWYS